jgi:Trypsin
MGTTSMYGSSQSLRPALFSLTTLLFPANTLLAVSVNPDLIAQRRPLYTTANDPALHLTSPGGAFDGVAKLSINRSDGTFLCSGTLLSNGREVLTAAHCLTDDNGTLNTISTSAVFNLPSGTLSLPATNFTVYPAWNGDFGIGYDLALITLNNFAPPEIPRYNLYTASDEVGQVVTKTGYGRSGQGDDGDILTAGSKRWGQNLYDALGDVLEAVDGTNPLPGAQLVYDFDDGTSARDAFGFFDSLLGISGLNDLGLGDNEVMSAPGDSGGPTFIDGKVTGITSYGLRLNRRTGPPSSRTSDIDNELNSSFGEFAIDTRVSFFADWINANLTDTPPPPVINGDLNGDGFVGVDDLNIVLNGWNQSVIPSSLLAGDPTGDGFVGVDDLNTVLINWNAGTPPTTGMTIPEPLSAAIFGLGTCVFALRRSRR